ncbi:MAG TPA: right-handed parallel beta-helix repeat-containing protein [Pyrinomonadaceae bacterium]
MKKALIASLSVAAALALVYLGYTFAQHQVARPRVVNPGAKTITVRPGDNLQRALDAAASGDEVVLSSGATYTGNFVLPVKAGDAFITVRSARCGELPEGVRVSPDSAPLMARLATPNVSPVLRAPAGSHHWRLRCLEFTQGAAMKGEGYNLIQLGEGASQENQKTLDDAPHHLEFDRVLVRARDDQTAVQRGITLNSASTSVTNSHISGIKWAGVETQALGGWNGPGPFLIENNYLEAASINILFGGAAPTIPNLVPSDIVIRNNTLYKRPEWRGRGYALKNLFELKNARRVRVTGNVMENSWADAQTGWAVIFNTFRDAGWEVVEDVTFSGNVIRNVTNGVNLRGLDTGDTRVRLRRVAVSDNLIELGAHGAGARAFQVLNGSEGVSFDHNTVRGAVSIALSLDTAEGFRHADLSFTNNLLPHGEYGVFGNGGAIGTAALNRFASAWAFVGNALYARPSGAWPPYPPGNFFPGDEAGTAGLKGADGLPVGVRAQTPAPAPTARRKAD